MELKEAEYFDFVSILDFEDLFFEPGSLRWNFNHKYMSYLDRKKRLAQHWVDQRKGLVV